MEKPFMLFASYRYYPEGGMGDFRGRFATVHDCIAEANRLISALSPEDREDASADVYDIIADQTLLLVWKDGGVAVSDFVNSETQIDRQIAMSKRLAEAK
jgi:hypothetical protein